MTEPSVLASPIERFRTFVADCFGLQFEDARLGWLADVLQRRLEANDQAAEAYLAQLQAESPAAELGVLARELTVPETYFFRNIEQFHALLEHIVPERLRAVALAFRPLRLLSAGCASGEEPYSIAMMLRESPFREARAASIRAVDLNPAVVQKARRARYTEWALRETPAAMRQRWFRREGRELALDDAIRGAVTFEERNLGDDPSDLWPAEAYDVIFCRNVLMYFTPQRAQAVVARIAHALAPGGYLFLGHAETLRGLSHDFHLRHTHGTFYYQRRDDLGAACPDEAAPGVAASAWAASVDVGDSWVEAIAKATERVRMLTDDPARMPAEATPSAAGPASLLGPARIAEPRARSAALAVQANERWHLGQALDLLRQERFSEALHVVRALPTEAARDPDVLLLHAVLLVHAGELAAAEAACQRLLEIDDLSAGAHYVTALCREGVGDREGAAERDRLAAYLDPDFAMPRMHLGLLARRAGDRDAARRELGQAIALLQREDASRLLFFGGGFHRDALLALCRAELRACADPP